MELKCCVVFTLVSLLSVTATPHGYGVKGGAVARAEAGAAAGAFSGIGLPLNIQSGPGFSGSFSKSASSSFASSSASSSSSSFSFGGAGGFGSNSLGTAANGGCSGGCQSNSKGINESYGTGSTADGLHTISGVKSNAAAGSIVSSFDSDGGVHSPCTNVNCHGQKATCEGSNCKDDSKTSGLSCTSGKCESKASETSSSDNNNKECTSGHCDTDSNSGSDSNSSNCKNGECNQNYNPTSEYAAANNNANCASGQCGLGTSTSATGNGPSKTPELDYGSDDIPVSITSTSTIHHLSDTAKTSTAKSQVPKVDCKNGNCDSSAPNTPSSYGYSSSSTHNQNQPQTLAIYTPSEPATHLTVPKQDEPCTHPNCKPPSIQLEEPKTTTSNLSPVKNICTGANCNYGYSHNSSPKIDYPQPQNTYTPTDSSTLLCNSPTCHSHKENTQPIKTIYTQSPPDQKGNNFYPSLNCASGDCGNSYNPIISQPKIPVYTQTYSPNTPKYCPSGNCDSHPSYQSSFDNQISNAQGNSPNCASGNCGTYPSYHITGIPIGPKESVSSQKPFMASSSNCGSGNCGNYPTSQVAIDSTKPVIPSYSGQPSICQSGTCGSYPSSPNLDSTYPRLPSYPQNILSNKPINCVSGNCAIYPSVHPSGTLGPQSPTSSKQPSGYESSGCKSGTCESNPTYQHESINSSGYQRPSYPSTSSTTNCASGNCAIYPSSPLSGSKNPPLSNGYAPSSIDTSPGPFSSGASTSTGSISSSGSCTTGNCPSYPLNTSEKLPDYVALGASGSTPNGGLFVPPSTSSSRPSDTAIHASSESGAATGAFSQSSILSSHKPNIDKEPLYTEGFGGPPGILKPFEFSVPHQTPTSNKKDQAHPQCSNGKCTVQSGADNSSDKHNAPSNIHSAGPCTSGNCGHLSGKPHYGQSNTATGAFAAAAAASDAVIYTGGFGGPPGLLKPYDGGKIGNILSISANKHQADASSSLDSKNDAQSAGGHIINSAYGALSGATSTANAGVFGGGAYEGGHNKAVGCDSGCGSSAQGSYTGNFGLVGGPTKSGILEKIHNGVNAAGAAAQSAASAISGAGARSFAVGGSFASSSAHSAASAGSATKGGYGR